MKWNTIEYIDCLSDEGLYSLSDKSFEMGFTDPPYNVNYKGKLKKDRERKIGEVVKYEDNRNDYEEWCAEWFSELKRICSGSILIHCGFPNLFMWCRIEEPFGILYHYQEDVQTGSSVAHLEKLTPILIYRKPKKRFKINPIKIPNRSDQMRGNFKHGCPMNRNVVLEILERQSPISVIDPFMGSGTTAYCCEKLGINYFGYEIDETVKCDYLKNKSQKGINSFLSP